MITATCCGMPFGRCSSSVATLLLTASTSDFHQFAFFLGEDFVDGCNVLVGDFLNLVMRTAFIVFADPHKFPRRFRQALTFVPPAVLAAIVVPGLLLHHATLDLTTGNPRWIAGVLAIVVGARTRNALAAIASGMVALWLLQWALG